MASAEAWLVSVIEACSPALWHNVSEPSSLVDLAARLAYGLAKNHDFVDGNKRTVFIAAYTFLAMNGIVVQASQQSVVEAMEALASSTDEPGRAQVRFADWLSSVTDVTAQVRQ